MVIEDLVPIHLLTWEYAPNTEEEKRAIHEKVNKNSMRNGTTEKMVVGKETY